MPTQSTTYNSRVTDEALEKRFRDTFRSQGGAELVDDLYAQGVIVPVVDFTQAATGDFLTQNLQTAWDFSTAHQTIGNTTQTLIQNAGFWQVDLVYNSQNVSAAVGDPLFRMTISDGLSSKVIWQSTSTSAGSALNRDTVFENSFVVFLRSNDSLIAQSFSTNTYVDVWYRQIATVTGDIVNPTGFTSS